MKNYLLEHARDGIRLTAEALVKGQVVRTLPPGPFDTGNASKETLALAQAIANHYFGASPADLGATAEANRQAPRILEAFLIHARIPLGGRLEISGDVLTRFFSLAQSPAEE